MKLDARNSHQRRRYNRVPASGTAFYRSGADRSGTAFLVDVDHSGVCLQSSRQFVPGQRLLLNPEKLNLHTELKGVVAWCGPADVPGQHRAGIRIYRVDDDTRLALCALVSVGLNRVLGTPEICNPGLRFVVRLSPHEEIIDLSSIWSNPEQDETGPKHVCTASY